MASKAYHAGIGYERMRQSFVIGNSKEWLVRPLTQDQLLYAAFDILKIYRLRAKLVTGDVDMEACKEASQRYSELLKDGKKSEHDLSYKHGYLPCEIMAVDYGKTYLCVDCVRLLHRPSFCSLNFCSGECRRCFVCARVQADRERWSRKYESEYEYEEWCEEVDSEEGGVCDAWD